MRETRGHHGNQGRQEGGYRENRQQRTRPSSSNRSTTRPQNSTRNVSSSTQHARRSTSEEHGSQCTHICSRRGIVLMCAFLCNLLVLFCLVAAYVTLSGMSAMNFGGGGSFVDVIIPFEGTELQKVRELDMQFTQMRAPGLYGGLAFSITFGILTLFFVISGNKPPYVLPQKLLIGQFAFMLIGAVAYVTAVGLYLHFVIKVNSTDVCLTRERLYARNGQTWMNCNVNGADGAVALFAIILVILYAVGAFLTFRTIRNVHQYNKERVRYEAERPKRPQSTQDTTTESGIYI
ncbi:MARVEL domain-containing protein 3 [Tachysurus fulvidraco]|uniref:MARVEL domain-containing protein 3 n=1 Tax=Tachysurus fulvidraco TaxID=1234273 RepID=UPI000F50560C|nr:MARVEL domain-containing protein 3 [Tachysurus fulvidraco]XP_027035383.1 MARVEL domain-containing protein 3 [Tachysurus fulvidraco]